MEDVEACDGRTVAVLKVETGKVHSKVLRMSDAMCELNGVLVGVMELGLYRSVGGMQP